MIALNVRKDTHPVLLPTLRTSAPSRFHPFDDASEITLKKGQRVFRDGSTSPYIYQVVKGFVNLSSYHDGREMLEDYYQPDELFNTETLFGKNRDGLTAEAMTQLTTIKKIPVLQFRQAMKADPALMEEIAANMTASLQRTQERLQRFAMLSSQQRVIHFLATHVLACGKRIGYDWVVKPALTHQKMGQIAGTSRQTITTTLNELRRAGIVHFNRNYLIVRDLEALKGKL